MSSLPFHFEPEVNNNSKLFSEPTSVLDSARFPSRQASSSSLSNGLPLPPLDSLPMDSWESVISANEFNFGGGGGSGIEDMALWVGCTLPSPTTNHVQMYHPNTSIFNQTPVFDNFIMNQTPKIGIGDEEVLDHLYKIAELVQTGNVLLAQEILARLNHQLSPIGKPFHRAVFYFKEALQLLLLKLTNQASMMTTSSSSFSLPFSLVYKISAYKAYSEISPLVHFANFTSNQVILDAMEGFERIHIVDFDIGYGCQWSSFMQELGLRNGGMPFLKITALVSPLSHDQLELGICRENLIQFASEINLPFEFEVMSVDSLDSCGWSVCFRPCENEGLAVNLPVSVLFSYQVSVPLVLRFVRQLCPRIVVSVDRGCDRNDLPFANHLIQAVQYYSNLLECLDAVNVDVDALQKIEKFLFQPGIEEIVMGRFQGIEKTQHWRTLFLSTGFSPVMFSSFAESQAECVVKRSPIRGFQVEKRQGSLVLSWQRKELVSVWAWRC